MSGAVLVTGATGFLGTQIIRELVAATDRPIVALVRAPDRQAAEHRLRRAWWDWPDLSALIGTRVEPLPGDVTLPGLGIADEEPLSRVTHIVHAAADLRIDAPVEDLRPVNVGGTANVVELARAIHASRGLARLAHVSTAYACGRQEGSIAEDDLADAAEFFNAYEQSKHEGERLVRAAMADLPVSIFRPGMVVGDSRTGAVKTFNTIYVPLRLYLSGELRVIPTRPGQRLNIVPADYVAGAVARLTFDPRAAGRTFHLTAPVERQPTVGDLLRVVRSWARAELGTNIPRPLLVPAPFAGRLGGRRLSSLRGLLPYFSDRREFRRDNADALLGPYPHDWRDLAPRLLDYALSKSFLHRSGRTVPEQVLFRLRSRSRPLRYRDWAGPAPVERFPEELRRDMLRAAGALRALGVGRGDRVAVVGLNSTRYLVADVAIGLAGAVSVPLYYTSPPAEIDAILAASGARLLLLGTPILLARLGEVRADMPVVSFCREPVPAGVGRAVMSWDAFLALGAGAEAGIDTEGVGPDDVATLRYTSGTTGPPKGVTFTHRQLRWMAETVAALVPWETRAHRAAYLSFLPMNHVVEGILGTYAPYYLPTSVDISFLEQFTALPTTLPRVRPTVFFSVPRVYERLWDSIRSHPITLRYERAESRPIRSILRRLIRFQSLQRAGFDRCNWLIAGSAPVDPDLLRSLSAIGIDVHNAYGLTEAPLIAINRRGDNRIGTVGRPLPETEVRVGDDGEILVRGPQVTPGYFDSHLDPPVRDGWLLTGDLGHLTPEGYLVIDGRRKDLIATAYGKKVQASKVEALLRKIPGVAEAMLVGEARPYCTALLWLREDVTASDRATIDAAVARVNANLSHPEQVKRWAILANDLSIEGGDLTANLKLKRPAVYARHAVVIEALYGERDAPECVLRLGGARREEPVPV